MFRASPLRDIDLPPPSARRVPRPSRGDGWNTLADGEEIYYISNPALGLWGTADRFADRLDAAPLVV